MNVVTKEKIHGYKLLPDVWAKIWRANGMKPTTFAEAVGLGDIDGSYVAEYICPLCNLPGELKGASCHNDYCQEAYDEHMEGAFE
jgi:hypothetical protein